MTSLNGLGEFLEEPAQFDVAAEERLSRGGPVRASFKLKA